MQEAGRGVGPGSGRGAGGREERSTGHEALEGPPALCYAAGCRLEPGEETHDDRRTPRREPSCGPRARGRARRP